MQARIADCHVMLPGKVSAYDGQFADVEIMVKHPLFDDDGVPLDSEDLGVLASVPVCWPRFGGFYLSGPLAKGDEGMLIFASTPIGEWRASGQKGDPDDASRHSIGWPVFLPQLFNDKRPLPDSTARSAGIVLGKEGSDEQLRIQSGLVQVGATGAVAVALSPSVATELGKIATSIGQCASYINGISPGTVTPYTPGSVASSLFKAK